LLREYEPGLPRRVGDSPLTGAGMAGTRIDGPPGASVSTPTVQVLINLGDQKRTEGARTRGHARSEPLSGLCVVAAGARGARQPSTGPFHRRHGRVAEGKRDGGRPRCWRSRGPRRGFSGGRGAGTADYGGGRQGRFGLNLRRYTDRRNRHLGGDCQTTGSPGRTGGWDNRRRSRSGADTHQRGLNRAAPPTTV